MWRRLQQVGLAAFLGAAACPAQAQGLPSSNVPALIQAEEINFDEDLGIVTAKGEVEITQGDRVLQADAISYNMRSEVVTASGNVRLVEPSGEIIFAEFAEVTGDLREAFIRDIRILMTDRSRLAGANGQRTAGNFTEVNKGVFSPCELCREDPTRPPLWQLKAQRVIHDQEDKSIRYHDAWLEMFGVPVAYTPYFQHPDPTVKRKTGFLAPTIGSSGRLGITAQVPFFWNIAPDRDLTISPILTSKESAVFVGTYREAFRFGNLEFTGSGTVADREQKTNDVDRDVFRGHVDATGRFDIDDTWRVGFDANRATDDTYLRVYKFSEAGDLTSRLFAEGFRGRNYLSIENFLYQGLQEEDDQGETPIISPLINYSFLSQPTFWDSTFSLDTDLVVLTRTGGRDSNRLSMEGGWHLPFTGPLGDRYEITALVTADGYWINQNDPNTEDVNPDGQTKDYFTGRVVPRLALGWRYPFVQSNPGFSQIVEPIAQVVVAPEGLNPRRIPDEDSVDFEFDDTNLFSLNRFPGSDRVDPGPRIDYGLKWSIMGDDGAYSTAFFGQSYRFMDVDQDSLFPADSGIDDQFSDFVGRVELKPGRFLDLTYRFRADKDTFSLKRSEISGRIGSRALNFDATYTFIDDFVSGGEVIDQREELRVQVNSQFSRYWSVFGSHRRDLERGDSLSWKAGITYEDECFAIRGGFERSFFNDRDVTKEDAFFVNLSFKHLGGVGGGN
ncbi:MAG: LPS assembly protein LptD [Kiloniellales bacterium]|nr:LPS assembly protein LptD [Kiloniellales bacterium]